MKLFLKIIIIILLTVPIFFFSIIFFSNGHLTYENTIEVNSNINIINDFMSDIENMKEYMPGITSIDLISGQYGAKNSKYKMLWEMGDQAMEMIATLKNNNLPDNICYQYETNGVTNIMTQQHKNISNHKTIVINKQEFIFHGIMKILYFLKIEGFTINDLKNQSQIYLENFKSFIENKLNQNMHS